MKWKSVEKLLIISEYVMSIFDSFLFPSIQSGGIACRSLLMRVLTNYDENTPY